MSKKCYIDGYLRSNFGDDLLFAIMTNRYPKISFYTYSDESYEWFQKVAPNLIVHSTNSTNKKIISRIKHIYDIFSNSKGKECFINLGGSIFIHHPYKRKIFNYLNIFAYALYRRILAIFFKKIFVIGANFGPYYGDKQYVKVNRSFFSRCEDVCFRDKRSYDIFHDISSVRLSTDIAFTYKGKNITKKEKQVFVSLIDPSNSNNFSFTNSQIDEYYKYLCEAITTLYNNGYTIVLSAFCRYQGDTSAVARLSDMLQEKKVAFDCMEYNENFHEIISTIQKSTYVLGTRFHASVLGILFNCITVPIVYSSKTTNMLSDICFPAKQIVNIKTNMCDIQNIIQQAKQFTLDNKYKMLAEEQFAKLDDFLK